MRISPDWLQFCKSRVAWAILERICGLEPFSETNSPRYLKLVTVPSVCPYTFISFWVPLALFVINLVFLASKISSDFQSITVIGKPKIGNISASYDNLSIMFFQSVRHDPLEKTVEERGCLTPTVFLNRSPMLLFI